MAMADWHGQPTPPGAPSTTCGGSDASDSYAAFSNYGPDVDLIAPGVNGFLFDPADPAALAGLMERIASGGLDLAAMGAAAQKAVDRFHPSKFAAAAADHIRRMSSLAPTRALPAGAVLSSAMAGAIRAFERLSPVAR